MKKVIGKEDNISSTSCNEFIINNKLVTYGHIISNSFNEYFVNVGRLLSEDTDCDTNSLHYVLRVRARYYKVLYLFLKNKTSYILLNVLFCLIFMSYIGCALSVMPYQAYTR